MTQRHLGSTTLLTDSTGYVVQALSYLPYGEEWTEYNEMQRPDSLSLGQYRFNGKERDPESGFLYYGQRYYGISYIPMWLSVDPMTDKYPGVSPYAYCLWNPVKLVDPDGRDIWLVNKGGERTKYSVGMSHEGFGVYTSRTIQALNKLADTKTMGNNIKQFTYNSSISVDIVESSDRTSSLARFSRGKQPVAHAAQEIEFNPYMGIEDVNTKEVMSPDACLGHEFGHIINVFDNTVNYHSRRLTKRDDVWDNEEEFYNIHTWEHGIISEWGELKREGHNSLDSDGNERYRVIDIRSREGIQFKE